jgi:hypothetical protein
MYKFGFKNTALDTKGAISQVTIPGCPWFTIICNNSISDKSWDTRSSRRVHKMALYHSARPNPQIRIHHWSACSICIVLHTTNFGAHTSWSLLCLLNFSNHVLSDKQKTTFSILIKSCVAQISTVSCRLWLRWEWTVMSITVYEKDCWKHRSLDHYKPVIEWAANAHEVTWIREEGKQNQHNFGHSVSEKLRENILWLQN